MMIASVMTLACLVAATFAAAPQHTPCANHKIGGQCYATKDRGVALIQSRPASIALEDITALIPIEEQLETCQDQEDELRREVEELRQKLQEAEQKCRRRLSAGLCAMFGDPHFTTFDGAHTILMRDTTIWVVKSQNVWIQALSRESSGDLMGLAISGPFMHGHTLIFANTSFADPQSPFTVLFNDKPILGEVDAQGRAEFNLSDIMWAVRQPEWNVSLHDRAILAIDEVVEFDVGTWSSRFSGKPKGGLYLFKFPEDVQLTASGADLMSAVVKMSPQEGGQAGYCGNFNGDASDEFKPPPEGSVPDVLLPGWNVPVGDGLESVPDSLDMFKTSRAFQELIARQAPAAEAAGSSRHGDSSSVPCTQDMLSQAEGVCSKFASQPALHAACLMDVCRSGDAAAADGVLAVGVLDGEVKTSGAV